MFFFRPMFRFYRRVEALRQGLQVSTGVGFWLVAAWGVVDAVLEWRKLDAAARRAQRKTANTSP